MTKLYKEPIQVQTRNGLPVVFRWRRKRYQVTSCAVCQNRPSLLKWWRDKGLPRYRCETRQGLVCDLMLGDGGWILERVWD